MTPHASKPTQPMGSGDSMTHIFKVDGALRAKHMAEHAERMREAKKRWPKAKRRK